VVKLLDERKFAGVRAMKTLTQQEKQILKEIQGLPMPFQKKVAGIIRILKAEFFNGKTEEKKATEKFLSACGTWEDERSINEQLKDIHSSRKSTHRTEKAF
jgi:thiamine kinase-like enzyme